MQVFKIENLKHWYDFMTVTFYDVGFWGVVISLDMNDHGVRIASCLIQSCHSYWATHEWTTSIPNLDHKSETRKRQHAAIYPSSKPEIIWNPQSDRSAIKRNMLSMLDLLKWNSRLIRLAATQEACSAMVLYGISFVGLIGRCPPFTYGVNIMGL